MNNCRQPNAFQLPRKPYPQPNPNLFCVFCSTANHNSNECSKYNSSKSFWQRVLADRRCKNCLRLYHRSDKCYSRSYCHFSACKRDDKHNAVLCHLRYRKHQYSNVKQESYWLNGAQHLGNRSYRARNKRHHPPRRKYVTGLPNSFDSVLPSSSVPCSSVKSYDNGIKVKNVGAQTTDVSLVPSNYVHSALEKSNENVEVKNVGAQTTNDSSIPPSSFHPAFVKPKGIIEVKDIGVQTTSLTEDFEMRITKESYEQECQTEVFTATVSIQTMVYIPPFIDMPAPPQIDENELECLKAKYKSKCSSYGKVCDVTMGPRVAEREVMPLFSKFFRSAVDKYTRFSNTVSELSE